MKPDGTSHGFLVICIACAHQFYWKALFGKKLANDKCPECRGTLVKRKSARGAIAASKGQGKLFP